MRKRLISPSQGDKTAADGDWLDLEHLAIVEVTSEDAAFPAESALVPGEGPGWRAAGPGPQTLRILFDDPRLLRRIRLEFVELDHERTQEFVLHWSGGVGGPLWEIVRQRWNFSPRGGTREVEEFQVNLRTVTVLELAITPDVAGGPAAASLMSLRLA